MRLKSRRGFWNHYPREPWVLSSMKWALSNGEAAGPDGLPSDLFKGAASTLAIPLHDLFAKVTAYQTEPLQNKGGTMYPIYKRGDPLAANSYRGIMLLNVMSKVYHSWLRRQIMDKLQELRIDTQIGGFKGQQATYGSQCLQILARMAQRKNMPLACIFIDVQGAYHFLVKEKKTSASVDWGWKRKILAIIAIAIPKFFFGKTCWGCQVAPCVSAVCIPWWPHLLEWHGMVRLLHSKAFQDGWKTLNKPDLCNKVRCEIWKTCQKRGGRGVNWSTLTRYTCKRGSTICNDQWSIHPGFNIHVGLIFALVKIRVSSWNRKKWLSS